MKIETASIHRLFFFLLLMFCWHQGAAQWGEKHRATSRASISATIVSVVDHNRDFVCFGTQINIQIPGYLAGYLKGNPGHESDVVIRSFSSSLLISQQEMSTKTGRKDFAGLVSLSDNVLQSSVQNWLEKPGEAESGVVSPEMVFSYTVGNQLNFEEGAANETDPTATFQITVNYN